MSNISRRSFLKASGVTLGASAVGVSLLGLASCSPAGQAAPTAAKEEVAKGPKVKLLVCSPTGSSINASMILAEALSDDVEIIQQTSYASREKKLEFESDDLVILVAPTYGGKIPEVPNLWTNLKGNNTPCIAASCYGNRACEMGVAETSDIVSANGFNVIGGIKIVTDHTTGGMLGRGRPDIEDQKAIRDFAKKITEKLAEGSPQAATIERNEEIYQTFPKGSIFQSSAVKVYNPDNCTKCLTCSTECTANAIDAKTLEINAETCVHCQRCTMVCKYRARHFEMDRSFEYAKDYYWPRKDVVSYL